MEAGDNKRNWMLWAGWALTILPSLLFTMSAVMKFVQPEGFAEQSAPFGYPEEVFVWIGLAEIISTALYLIPQTSALGALLLTAYLGGATATHVRISDPFFIPIAVGVVVWAGLYLRDPRVRALLPLRRKLQ